MNVAALSSVLVHAASERSYFRQLVMLEQTVSLVKARLLITSQLFVQVYRNDRFDTTNFALIHNGRRIYGRDQLDGRWHKHPHAAPQGHDHGGEGSRPTSLVEFLDEVEELLAARGLP